MFEELTKMLYIYIHKKNNSAIQDCSWHFQWRNCTALKKSLHICFILNFLHESDLLCTSKKNIITLGGFTVKSGKLKHYMVNACLNIRMYSIREGS